MRWLVRLAALQGIYYAATGAWSLVHLESFEAVTGPKTDDWLVKTVGMLVLAIGIALLLAAARLHVPVELAVLALSSAAGLAAVDVLYALTDAISDVYLLDALAQTILVALWSIALWSARHEPAVWGREPPHGPDETRRHRRPEAR